mgnify:CR=1 FL=1
METFLVLQVIWDTFLIFLFALGLSTVISLIACYTMSEEQIETFLEKNKWY